MVATNELEKRQVATVMIPYPKRFCPAFFFRPTATGSRGRGVLMHTVPASEARQAPERPAALRPQ